MFEMPPHTIGQLSMALFKARSSIRTAIIIFSYMQIQTFTAVIHREEDLLVAECPEVGTVSQGSTIEEALANLEEATELYLEGGYTVSVPSLPRCITYGKTVEEAIDMARDAIKGYVESLIEDGEEVPVEEELLQCRLTVKAYA